MTTFLLVPGLFMGGWAWEAVAAELTAGGHRAVPVTLPGLGERAGEGVGSIGLAEHTAHVRELLDAEGPGVALVAHSYAAFPALAAADQRAGQVERVVFVDTGMPENGESVLTSFAGNGISGPIEDGVLPVPSEPAGIPAAELERYHRLATPHPAATLTDPIELTGAWRKLPTTGVFCLDNGLSLEVARALHGSGDPRFAKLTEPGVTFFELATGHFPMLSAPVELAAILVRAAAGEGVGLYG
ncbi:pimeloyl-ACP methyl ester carboxylesterase [Kitasatospora sp. GAS204A]|uniref:alpha/beta fold hydrolase n=1 Tax=unclassified Kitasatospora TaxID=2633591 RepID=UPI0024731CA6|nr:alpha/beta hydrolase [Kitasatospora sp. GAS204B]MDH6120371.1 pimeloyl-ACP methyl ester carboxylesterase [Kitasatospora sp. GAS204B]